ncbi:hypothetical protein QL285_081713 [Trifolium repens]|nr:hypothetical protein QL285_081713 [Trifolium repens]
MTDCGYNNFYTSDEYESYQQYPLKNYGQTPFQESNYYPLESDKHKHVAYCKLCNGDHPTGHCPPMTEEQFAQMIKQMADKQSMEVQTNTQTTLEEKDNILTKNEECGESVEECVEKHEEDRMFKGCGVEKIAEEIETPHEIELPQEFPSIEEDNNVDKDEVMRAALENEGLLDKEGSYEQKKET